MFRAALLLSLLIPSAGVAGGLSLDDALREALASNPELLAARKAHEAASARILQAAALNDPLLELEYDRIDADRMLSGHPMTMYGITQEIPFPTKLYYRAKIASRIARVAYANYLSKERDITARVKGSFAELFLAHAAAGITGENRRILDQFSRIATARYGAAKGTQAEALKAQVELARADNELVMIEQRRLTAQARLNVLMDRPPERETGDPVPARLPARAPSLEELYALAREHNPDLAAYRYAVERGEAALALSMNEFMPDLMVKFRQMVQNGNLQGGMWAGTLGVTIPLWFFQKQAFGVKEMRRELEGVKAERRMKEQMVLFDVRDSLARAAANWKVLRLYESAFIPQAEETVQAALKAYESGKGDFLNLLDSQRMLTDFRNERAKAAMELSSAAADLEKAIGTELSTR
ncbi:MAG: TolC family protein [Chlamydiota bacterium]